MSIARQAFFDGVRAEVPILLGVIPFGLIYGVAALAAGIPPPMAQAMSWIVFAGSGQFVIAQLVAGAAPAFFIVVTAFVVNLRHVLYSLLGGMAAALVAWRTRNVLLTLMAGMTVLLLLHVV